MSHVPAPDDLAFAGVHDLLAAFERGDATPTAVLAAQEERLERLEPILRCYVTHDAAGAAAAAQAADERWARGDAGPLLGITLGVKDLYDVEGLPTTGGSRAYGHEPAARDAAAVARLRQAGAVLTGKTNTEELAFGVVTAPTRNPYDPEHIPGGSSGGSAAALAAGLVTLAIGTDTGGSIRIPSALCGVCGLKPSRGLVSRSGVMPLSDSLDHTGPMAREIASLRACLDAMAAPDPDDPLSLPALPPTPAPPERVGVPWSWLRGEIDADTAELFAQALQALEDLGFPAVALDWPPPEEFARIQMRIRAPETYLTHRDAIADRPERFGPGLVDRIAAGRDSSAVDYVLAQRERHNLARALEQDLESRGVGLVALPTTPLPAPRAGEAEVRLAGGQVLGVREALIRYTGPFNVTGWPALSLPMGVGREGLPRGVQLATRLYADRWLLELAQDLAACLPAQPRPAL